MIKAADVASTDVASEAEVHVSIDIVKRSKPYTSLMQSYPGGTPLAIVYLWIAALSSLVSDAKD
jgi:hypothetical protein